jgi:hypothetical protein
MGEGGAVRTPVGVVIRAGRKQQSDAIREVTRVLQAVGSPVPVAGWVADDPVGVAALAKGSDGFTLRRTALMRSVADLRDRLHRTWELPTPGPTDSPAVVVPGQGEGRRVW